MVKTALMSAVRCWAIKCKAGEQGRADLCDKQQSGRPSTANNKFHKKADELITGHCYQAWHFIEMCASHYCCSSVMEGLCEMGSLHTDGGDESFKS
jgi:hypothetical protein